MAWRWRSRDSGLIRSPFEAEGSLGWRGAPGRRGDPAQLRWRAVDRLATGPTVADVARDPAASEQASSGWRRQARRDRGLAGAQPSWGRRRPTQPAVRGPRRAGERGAVRPRRRPGAGRVRVRLPRVAAAAARGPSGAAGLATRPPARGPRARAGHAWRPARTCGAGPRAAPPRRPPGARAADARGRPRSQKTARHTAAAARVGRQLARAAARQRAAPPARRTPAVRARGTVRSRARRVVGWPLDAAPTAARVPTALGRAPDARRPVGSTLLPVPGAGRPARGPARAGPSRRGCCRAGCGRPLLRARRAGLVPAPGARRTARPAALVRAPGAGRRALGVPAELPPPSAPPRVARAADIVRVRDPPSVRHARHRSVRAASRRHPTQDTPIRRRSVPRKASREVTDRLSAHEQPPSSLLG